VNKSYIKSGIFVVFAEVIFSFTSCGSGIGDFENLNKNSKQTGGISSTNNGSLEQVQALSLSHEAGVYARPFTLILSSPTENSTIKYTTDGSDPQTSSTAQIRSSVIVNKSTTIKAYAYADNLKDSETIIARYTFPNVTVSTTIQAAIDGANPGDIIHIPAKGTAYTESFTINKRVSIIGDGNGSDPMVDTVIQNDDQSIITLSASGLSELEPILIKNLRIEPKHKEAIILGSYDAPFSVSVSFLKLKDLVFHGISVNNDDTSKIRETGLAVYKLASLSYLTIDNCEFNDLSYGITSHKDMDDADSTDNFNHVTIIDSRFISNSVKGIYVEKLSNAVFRDLFVYNNGQLHTNWMPGWMVPWHSGIDINLKGMAYENYEFVNLIVMKNGLGSKEGTGLAIKARGSGNDTAGGGSYASNPASLTNVTIEGGIFSDNERGIRIGEPGQALGEPANLVISYSSISDNVHTYGGSDGSAYGGLINLLQSGITISAENVWWGHSSGPTHSGNPGGTGETVIGDVGYSPFSSSQ